MRKSTKAIVFSLLDTPALGGAEQYLWDHLAHLAKRGHPVVVACNNPTVRQQYQQWIASNRFTRFRVIVAPYRLDAIGNWKGLLKFFWSLPAACRWLHQTLRQLRRRGPVICYWPGWSDRLVFSPIARWLGCTLVWIEIGPLEPLFRRNWGFPRWLYAQTHHLPHLLTATSEWTRQSCIRTGHIAQDRMHLVYPGVAPLSSGQLTTYRRRSQRWRQTHHPQHFLVGWVGRLARENELEVLLHAIASLNRRQHKYQVLVIGDGPDRTHYHQLVHQLGIEQQVTWAGYVSANNKFMLLAACDAFVFTRAWDLDGFGMTTIEAMTVGVPVITTRFGPQREIVTHHQQGLLFQPHNSQSLAQQLRHLYQAPELRRHLSQSATAHLSRFHLNHTLNVLDQVWQHLPVIK